MTIPLEKKPGLCCLAVWMGILVAFLFLGCQQKRPTADTNEQSLELSEEGILQDALDQEIRDQMTQGPAAIARDERESSDPQEEAAKDQPVDGNAVGGTEQSVDEAAEDEDEVYVRDSQLPPIPEGFVRIDPEQEVWVNTKEKQVLLGGTICFRRGALEFFACVRGSKEHESIVSVNALSSKLHLGLLTIGLQPGTTVRWDPEYQPATGPRIQIDVLWLEDGALKQRAARDMVYNARAQQPLSVDWVFGGSIMYEDPETKQNYYLADGGEMVSVSNFSSSTLDLPLESSSENDWLLFTAQTKNIPPLGTRVLLRFSEAQRTE